MHIGRSWIGVPLNSEALGSNTSPSLYRFIKFRGVLRFTEAREVPDFLARPNSTVFTDVISDFTSSRIASNLFRLFASNIRTSNSSFGQLNVGESLFMASLHPAKRLLIRRAKRLRAIYPLSLLLWTASISTKIK